MRISAMILSKSYLLGVFLVIQYQLVTTVGNDTQNVEYNNAINESSPRIVGGKKAHEGDVIGIISLQTWKGEHMCGGTWFKSGNESRSMILTAAHCVMNSKNQHFPKLLLQIMGDDLTISTTSRSSRRQIRKISKIVAHPYYNPNNLMNDIAVIFLKSPFDRTNTFAPVLLANQSIHDYQQCTIAGWGLMGENGPSSYDLIMANVSVVPRDVCNSRSAYKGIVGKHAFCAASKGVDSCRGDSGGGIFSNNNLVGIVSFGIGCGQEMYPGVYTNIYHYTHWIQQVVNSSSKNDFSNGLILIAIVQLLSMVFLH